MGSRGRQPPASAGGAQAILSHAAGDNRRVLVRRQPRRSRLSRAMARPTPGRPAAPIQALEGEAMLARDQKIGAVFDRFGLRDDAPTDLQQDQPPHIDPPDPDSYPES